MNALDQIAQILLMRLGWSSLQAIVLIALMALLIRLLPRLPAALRCTLWWLVGLQLIVGLVWHAPLQLPLLSPPSTQQIADAPATQLVSAPTTLNRQVATPSAPQQNTLRPATEAQPVRWPLLMGLFWLAGLALQLPRAIRHGRQSRILLRDSVPSTDPELQAKCVATARAFGLRRPPRLHLSDAITSPQVIGLRRPTILLPARQALAPEEASLALAHEVAHLRRGDLWLGWIPALAQRLFFFHPLVPWAMREYALSREAACDAQVLIQPGTEPQRYGHLLLRLGVAQPTHAGLASAAPSFYQLKRRLTMLQQSDMHPRQRRQGWLLVALIAVAGVLPYRLTATAANPPATTTHTSSSVSTPAADSQRWQQLPSPPPPPLSPPPLPPPLPPTPPAPPIGNNFGAHHVHVAISSSARDGFALFDDDTVIIRGTDSDLATAKRLRPDNHAMLWLRRGDQSWLIRDPAMLKRARAISQPLSTLDSQQGALAGKQGELVGRQAGLAARHGTFAYEQAALAQRQARLAQQVAARDGDTAALAARRQRLDIAQAEMEQRQQVAQEQLDKLQRDLEVKQIELDGQQTALEKRQQQVSTQTERQLSKLLDEALAKGVAKPVTHR